MHQEYTFVQTAYTVIAHECKLPKARLIIRGGLIDVYAVGRVDMHKIWYHLRVILDYGEFMQLRDVNAQRPAKTKKKIYKDQKPLL